MRSSLTSVTSDWVGFVACRYCGASHAKPHENKWGLCNHCFDEYTRRNGFEPLTDEDVLVILSRDLSLIQNRRQRGKPMEKCQALTDSGWSYQGEFQCREYAVHIRDGRHVCNMHKRKKNVVFVDAVNSKKQHCAQRTVFQQRTIDLIEMIMESDSAIYSGVKYYIKHGNKT